MEIIKVFLTSLLSVAALFAITKITSLFPKTRKYINSTLIIVMKNGMVRILSVIKRRPANPEDLNLSPAPAYIQTEVIMDGRILDENLKPMGLDDNNQLTVFAMA